MVIYISDSDMYTHYPSDICLPYRCIYAYYYYFIIFFIIHFHFSIPHYSSQTDHLLALILVSLFPCSGRSDTMFHMLRAFFYIVLVSTQGASSFVVRPNVGAVFVPQPMPPAAMLHWHHTLALPLRIPPFQSETYQMIDCLSNVTDPCYALQNLQNLYFNTTERVYDQLTFTKDQIVNLISSKEPNRQERGWFDIIGKGAKSLFGLATENDVKILKNHIARLRSMVKDNNND